MLLFREFLILKLVLLEVSLLSLSTKADHAGVLYIRLDYYRQRDSSNCDLGPWKLNINNDRCDPYFIIAARPANWPRLGSFESRPFSDAHHTLQFGATVAQLPNPIAFPFGDSDGMNASRSAILEVEITVKDHDPHTRDDLMERFHWSLPIANLSSIGNGGLNSSGDQAREHFSGTDAILTGQLRGDQLALEAWTVCRPGRYGPGCGVACRPRLTPSAGFGCDRATGRPVCLPGFANPDAGCSRRDRCAAAPCANGGDCIDEGGGAAAATSFRCRCRPGFSGPRCQQLDRPCRAESAAAVGCQRGVCARRRGDDAEPECVCEMGFQGARCEQDIDECRLLSPCVHGATCVNSVGSFACNCPSGYSGKLCQLPPMVMPPEAARASSAAGNDDNVGRHPAAASGTVVTAVLAAVIAVLLLLLALLLLRHRRWATKSAAAAASAPTPSTIAWHRRGDGDDQSCYESVDNVPQPATTGSNPYEEEENFPNAAYAMHEAVPLNSPPTPPPPPPPPRLSKMV